MRLGHCQEDVVVRSVLIPVAEIVKEIQLRVVVDQLEFVVPVVGGLAAPRHAHHLPVPSLYRDQCLQDRHCGKADGSAGAAPYQAVDRPARCHAVAAWRSARLAVDRWVPVARNSGGRS